MRVPTRAALAVAAGTAVLATAIPVLAAPPITSDGYVYSGGTTCDPSGVTSEPAIFTRAGFTATPDGDNDVNVGDTITVSLIVDYSAFADHVDFGITSGTVHFDIEGTVVDVAHGPIAVDAESENLIASTDLVVTEAMTATVLDLGVTSWDWDGSTCTTADGEGFVNVYVNAPPEATDDAATTEEDTLVTVDVLANDTANRDSGLVATNDASDAANQDDVDDAADPAIAAQAADGECVVNADDTISYQPNDGFVGSDSCSYTIADGDGESATAVLSIEVTAESPTPTPTPTAPGAQPVDAEPNFTG